MAVILGRIDDMCAANILASDSCAPRYGHLKTALRASGYQKHYQKRAIKYDTQTPEDIEDEKLNKDW